uniref:Uncharacterized protein n=1 Tax=Candidatus Kentrum sp. TC TaxID=2126339 RepID=A0A451AH25_9GAMM|nr:MAG: hypothetical protein BECKTC1821E_GA0114239_11551 [Candidatus Kentron sp. TC]VFK52793.1 MAG: hypothetical protein BECKTC1821D_GA0114238_12113 [Candidatus Kentron sp. TC]VFK65347.1 MAG: hypothetical protein BECKTC1821F_GA0114240_11813 [Candidatus Kentron sp. TC]
MPLTNQELLGMQTSLRARWNNGLLSRSEDWKRIAGEVRSNSDSHTQPGIAETKKAGFLKIACIIMITNRYFAISKSFFDILLNMLDIMF